MDLNDVTSIQLAKYESLIKLKSREHDHRDAYPDKPLLRDHPVEHHRVYSKVPKYDMR
jgi:hypothetical protein